MSQSRQLKLNAFMRPTTLHAGSWRFPGAYPDANFNLHHITILLQDLVAHIGQSRNDLDLIFAVEALLERVEHGAREAGDQDVQVAAR